jgi:hypothetical protein
MWTTCPIYISEEEFDIDKEELTNSLQGRYFAYFENK